MRWPADLAPPQVEEISGLAELERLRPAWQALWERIPGAQPFLAPDWLIPWWRHIGEGDLLAIVVRGGCEGELLGLAPFYIHHQAGSGLRLLLPLGIATTDYLDALVLPGRAEAVMACVLGRLAAHAHRWDAADWPQLRPGAALLRGAAPAGWEEEVHPGETCPVLCLLPGTEAVASAVPRRMRQNLRTALRRAEAEGDLRWERAEDRTLEEIFDALLRLHRARWAERGEAGVLATRAVETAHREALPGLLRAGVLRLHALRLNGAVIAVLYALADRPGGAERRVYYYIGGFDPRFAALSPGALLVGRAIEEAAAEGAVAFDFLRGAEPYKYRWGARDTPTWRRWLRPGMHGR